MSQNPESTRLEAAGTLETFIVVLAGCCMRWGRHVWTDSTE